MTVRFFVDMDGTLAKWSQIASQEELYEKGYFLRLKPQEDLIGLLKNSSVDAYILSAVLLDSPYALQEKNAWLDKYYDLPMGKRIFIPNGESKASYVERRFGCNLNKSFVLIDDYNKNLFDWSSYGGTSIKWLNDINHKRGTWKGYVL